MLPPWASSQHPIVQREVTLWRQRSRRWRWALVLLFGLPLLCSCLCSLSLTPALLEANTPGEWLALLGLMLGIVLWILQGFLTFGVWLLISIGAATLIARERETQNWELLKITTLKVSEIVGAKVAGLLHWLALPIGFTMALRIGLTLLFFVFTLLVVYVSPIATTLAVTPLALQLSLLASGVVGSVIVIIYLFFDLLLSVFYSCTIGLLASTFARTSATAIAIMFGLHFVLGFFVIAPVQQVANLTLTMLSLPWLNSNNSLAPFVYPALSLVAGLGLNVIMQLALGGLAYALALNQAQRIGDND